MNVNESFIAFYTFITWLVNGGAAMFQPERLLRCQRLEAQRETTLNNVSFINQSSLFVKTCKSKNDSIDFKIGNNSSWHNTSPRNFCNRIELSEKKELTDELIHKSTWPKTPHIKKYTHTHITHLRQLPWK